MRDTIPPVVKILSPPCSTYVNHLIKIVGTVKDESAIKYWQIYWGEGVNPSKWNFINFDTKPCEKSVLGEWDTYGLTPGVYAIYLFAEDFGGNVSRCTTWVWVDEPPCILQFGTMGFCKGEFRLPKDVAVDEEGNIYVLDTQNDRVQKFDNQRNFILEFGKHGRSKGEFILIMIEFRFSI